MKIGVFSDSHDNLPKIEQAIDIFLSENVDKIVHCGDLVAPFIVRALKKLEGKNIEALGVFGNNDGERENMNKLINPLMYIRGDFLELEWGNKKIAVYHGTNQRILDNILHSQFYDLVLCGHTHNLKIDKIGKTLRVNPGETCGYLTGHATCAIVDLGISPFDENAVNIFDLK
ncbi:MAG: metallophosphoesterase [Promethearchaeota archaeon]